MKLRAVGLCGVDDSVHPKQLVMYAHLYPFLEFGVLFRPDKEGQPRYPTPDWVRRLSKAVKLRNEHEHKHEHNHNTTPHRMKLAAHLCERRVDEVLRGDDAFVQQLQEWGFGRVQINATAVNGVDTSVFEHPEQPFVRGFLSVAAKHPNLEFILQQNEETRPLWEGVLEHCGDEFPDNVSMLLDESKGTGVLPNHWPPIPPLTPCCSIGYAGGIGPGNITSVFDAIEAANDTGLNTTADASNKQTNGDFRGIWIDMESSLRSETNGRDVFDLEKCFRVVMAVCDDKRLFSHPSFLVE